MAIEIFRTKSGLIIAGGTIQYENANGENKHLKGTVLLIR
jgi:hypothetical protein